MNCRKLINAILLYGTFFIYTSPSLAQTYGLKFNSHEVTLDKRTELNLTPDDYFTFEDNFEISFDYKTSLNIPNSNQGMFGYVFRIIDEDNTNIDLLSTPTPVFNLNIILGKSNTIVAVKYPENDINTWISLKVKFLLSEDRMILYTPDSFYVQENIGFKKKDAFKIIFGANDFMHFKTTDVPSMFIKDIKISEKGKLIYHWPLNEDKNNIATDRIKHRNAIVKNPSWLMFSHQSWQLNFENEIDDQVLFASDPKNGKVFVVGKNELLIFTTFDEKIEKIKYKNKPLFINVNYRAIYNSQEDKLYCYVVEGLPIYSLNVKTGEWNDNGSASENETKFRHHNSFYNPSDNSIYLFGGYGFHKYNNEIRKIDINNKTFHDLPTDSSIFRPRYLAGLGELNDTIYILGGYGSESGNQLINPQSYYDLFGYSINDSSLFKKFEVPRIIEDMIVANSMWIDEFTRNYFALVFEKIKFEGYLQLIKGNLDIPKVEMVGDKIPFQFLDVRSTAALLYVPQYQKLFAYTSYFTDSKTTKFSIYSISYPPNKFDQEEAKLAKSKSYVLFIAGITIFVLLILIIWFYKKGRKRKVSSSMSTNDDISFKNAEFNASGLKTSHPEFQLIFFGGFQVFDKDFADITNKFSPLLKELFLLIWFHTIKNNKGISTEKITEVLWYDKTEKSARNNRAVNIAKLRSILSEIGNCELTNKTSYWKIVVDKHNVKSDYVEFLQIASSKNNLTKQSIKRLLEITEKGAFLSNVHYEWLDEFKSLVSDTIINTLVGFAKSHDIKGEAEFIIHLADSIFNFDIVDEDAMILKCQAQHSMGKHAHAKATYEKFFKEYRNMYGQEYEQSFLEILEIKE